MASIEKGFSDDRERLDSLEDELRYLAVRELAADEAEPSRLARAARHAGGDRLRLVELYVEARVEQWEAAADRSVEEVLRYLDAQPPPGEPPVSLAEQQRHRKACVLRTGAVLTALYLLLLFAVLSCATV